MRPLWPLFVGFAWLGWTAPMVADPLPNGVACGDVDQGSAVLWARSDAPGTMTFEFGADPTFAVVEGAATAEVVEALVPVKVEIAGLSESTQYHYRATDAVGDSSTGRFRTAASAGLGGLRFGVSGDWRGELKPYPAISNIPERDLDFFIALGDTIYADFPSVDVSVDQARTLDEFRRKHNEGYRERFGLRSWADARASTSILAVIDDHEVTNDFAGGAPVGSDLRFDTTGAFLNETMLFANGLQAFVEFNPIRDEFYGDTGDPRTAGKRSLYRVRTYGRDAAVIMLDARSFRDVSLDDVDFPSNDAFREASFDPSRTMLGQVQFDRLLLDLQTCEDVGVTWKFILVPEPIQNFGPVLGGDRFEGYAYERSQLLGFIDDNAIDNVVFVAADIHGTIVNNLVYRRSADAQQLSTTAFEITTGSVAFDAPFGPTVVAFIPPLEEFFRRLGPGPQNGLLEAVGNLVLGSMGLPPFGLLRSPIDARLIEGGYVSINTYGWTEFDIDSVTQCLTVTTYGIDWYTEQELLNSVGESEPRPSGSDVRTEPRPSGSDVRTEPRPSGSDVTKVASAAVSQTQNLLDDVLSRRPRVVSRFVVQPRLNRTDPAAPPPCFTTPPLCGVMELGILSFISLTMLAARQRHRGIRGRGQEHVGKLFSEPRPSGSGP